MGLGTLWGTAVPPACVLLALAPHSLERAKPLGSILDQPLSAPGLTPGEQWSSYEPVGSWRPSGSVPRATPPGTPPTPLQQHPGCSPSLQPQHP